MSEPSKLCLSNFISELINNNCPADLLISDILSLCIKLTVASDWDFTPLHGWHLDVRYQTGELTVVFQSPQLCNLTYNIFYKCKHLLCVWGHWKLILDVFSYLCHFCCPTVNGRGCLDLYIQILQYKSFFHTNTVKHIHECLIWDCKDVFLNWPLQLMR